MLCNYELLIYLSYIVYGAIKKKLMKDQELNKYHLMPIHMVYENRYILQDPGRLYRTKVESGPYDIYSGGCVLIDNASHYMSIKYQVDINGTENVKEKLPFDREDKRQGLMIKVYHTDNGIFNTSKFIEELLKKQKKYKV